VYDNKAWDLFWKTFLDAVDGWMSGTGGLAGVSHPLYNYRVNQRHWWTTSIRTSSATTSIVSLCWMRWQSLPPSVCLSLLSCQNLIRCGMMRWRNPTFVTTYDTWHLHFHWRHCDSSGTGRCHLYWHHPGAMLHSLLQFTAS
jgi:hypothetical protein